MNNMSVNKNLVTQLKKKMTKNSYMDNYGGSVIITTLVAIGFIVVIGRLHYSNIVEPIRRNWTDERCKPHIMPFAGIIMNPKDKSKSKFTSDNFTNCTTSILSNIIQHFLQPIYTITDFVMECINEIAGSLNFLRAFKAVLRNKMKLIFSYVFARLVNITIPLQKIMMNFKDTLGKTTGILSASLYTMVGIQMAFKGFVKVFITVFIIFISIIIAIAIMLWIPFFTWPAAAATSSFAALLAIPLAIITGWMVHILNIQSGKVPVPGPANNGCFDKNTLIDLQNNKKIKIKELTPGTILKNGDRVTAVFKYTRENLDVYNLNDIIVTGCHKVFHNNLGWVKVEKHPKSKKIENYTEQIVYCLNTQSKRIFINEHKFLDWDDLEPIDIIKLKNLNYLSNKSSISDIHKYLESGLDGNVLIELENGLSVKLKDLHINDQLKFNERVIGLVEIDTKNIPVEKYTFDNFNIIGGPNIRFKDSDLGISNTLNITGKKIEKPKKLYHIITDTGEFTIDSIKIKDYNSAIEDILDMRDKLFDLF